MKIFKKIILVVLMLVLSVCSTSCIVTPYINNTRETASTVDEEYISAMLNYIQDKYSITVDVVESIFPDDSINTALNENVLVVQNDSGVIANVKARLSSPYDFYDDYIESRIAFDIQSQLNISISAQKANAKVYVAVDETSMETLDSSADNISSLTFVSTVEGYPTDKTVEELYDIYTRIQEKGYSNVFFLVGFTDGSAEFEKAVNNYMIYGKSGWRDYSGEVYAELYVAENGLTYEGFRNSITEF